MTRRSLHTFARGRLTARYMGDLGVPAGCWSVAPDVAFAYRPEYSLTAENDRLVADLLERLARVRASGADVVALVPSSLVHQKMTGQGRDYVALLRTIVDDLHARGLHVLVMPNATRAGLDVPRNNDINVISRLRDRIAAEPDGIDAFALSYVDFDLNTASIRSWANGAGWSSPRASTPWWPPSPSACRRSWSAGVTSTRKCWRSSDARATRSTSPRPSRRSRCWWSGCWPSTRRPG